MKLIKQTKHNKNINLPVEGLNWSYGFEQNPFTPAYGLEYAFVDVEYGSAAPIPPQLLPPQLQVPQLARQ